MIMNVFVAFISCLLFAVFFSAPRAEILYCGVVGAIGWLVYLLLKGHTDSVVMANLLGSAVITYCSRSFSFYRRMPLTVYLIPGIITLVPGAAIYYTVYYLLTGSVVEAFAKGMETFKVAGAIAVGIVFVLAIPSWAVFLSKTGVTVK